MRPTRFAAAVAAAAFLAACSSSTSPTPQQQAQTLAKHLDTLYVTAAGRADVNEKYNQEATNITYAELGAYLGALPTNVTVTTASSSAAWKAFELEGVSNGGDTTYYVIAYPEANLHTSLLAQFDGTGSADQATLVVGDSIAIDDSDISGTTGHTAVGGACNLATGLTNPQLSEVVDFTCLLATFGTTLTVDFPATDGVDAAYTSLGMTGVSISGARLQENAVVGAPLSALMHHLGVLRAKRTFSH